MDLLTRNKNIRQISAATQVNNPFTRSAGGDKAVGLNGMVYTCWAGVTETSLFEEIMVGFASSADDQRQG